MIPDKLANTIATHIQRIYGEHYSEGMVNELYALLAGQLSPDIRTAPLWDETSVMLITYGDSVTDEGRSPLKALHGFLNRYLGTAITWLHLLPFFPYSSDDGFSVMDYLRVNPELGDWSDIKLLAEHYRLQGDLVINHVSRHHAWFKDYLKGSTDREAYFIALDPDTDLSAVTRPRSSPVLTPFQRGNTQVFIWTTFSDDQVDLNFRNPAVLLDMIRVLVFYLRQGIRIIRLDAIAFLWKKPGTSCLHLPETHEVVKLIRTIGSAIDPGFILLTETNVPNRENLSYFGSGDEAHLVYQFSLPPLVLYTLFSGHAGYLTAWLKSLPDPGRKCSFLNFTASHDGIGLRPLEGLIPSGEVDRMLGSMHDFGGKVSYKRNADGSESAYEINITYFDALKGTVTGTDDQQARRFLCSQTIMLGLKGIPAIYIHSMLASFNDYEGVKRTGRLRSINRKKYRIKEIEQMLDRDSVHRYVFQALKRMLEIRRKHPVFHPDNPQEILDPGPEWVAFRRRDPATGESLTCISNITARPVELPASMAEKADFAGEDLLSGEPVEPGKAPVSFLPYQTLWILSDGNKKPQAGLCN